MSEAGFRTITKAFSLSALLFVIRWRERGKKKAEKRERGDKDGAKKYTGKKKPLVPREVKGQFVSKVKV